MRRRIVPATAAATLVFAGLTGCSAAANTTDACIAPLSAGALSESVTLNGVSDGAPEVSIASDLEILNAQRSIVESGVTGGRVAEPGSILSANVAYFDASTGDIIETSAGFGTGRGSELFLASADGGAVLQGLLCTTPGDVVAIALPSDQSAGAVATPGSSLVAVAEIVDVYAGVAEGKSSNLPNGFPAVVTNENGRPGVVLPPQAPPAEVQASARIVGDGAVVEPESMVIGTVLTVGWDGTQLKNSWETGPENFGTEAQIEQSGATFRSSLNGFTVGSQVIVIDPGNGSPRVSVIDILAIA